MKLQEILTGQDFGQKEMDKVATKVLNDEPQNDPITAIIVNAWVNNGGDTGEFEPEYAVTDLEYAINQLRKAKNQIEQIL